MIIMPVFFFAPLRLREKNYFIITVRGKRVDFSLPSQFIEGPLTDTFASLESKDISKSVYQAV